MTPSIALVGEAPGRTELIRNVPFVGTSGKLLRQTLEAHDVDPKKVWIGNACLCGDGRTTPSAAAIRACRPGLIRELQELKPEVVILLGASALYSLTDEIGITQARGRYFWNDEIECFCIPTFHPAAILRDPSRFSNFADDIGRAIEIARGNPPEVPAPPELVKIQTVRDLHRMFSDFEGFEGSASVDIETTGLNPRKDTILRIGIASSSDRVYIIYPEVFREPDLRSLLERSRVDWVGHNSQFDSMFLKQQLGIDWRPTTDTLLAHYCVNELRGHRLKTLAAEYLAAPEYTSELTKHATEDGKTSKAFDKVPDNILDTYLGWDCHYTWRLAKILREEMREEDTERVHDEILIPASNAFRDIELHGVLIDVKYLENLRDETREIVRLAEKRLQNLVGRANFNVNSYKQVAELLYDEMGLPSPSNRGTAREILEPFVDEYPIVGDIIELRQTKRISSTYIDGILKRVDSEGRVHPEFLLFGTQTGRLSCTNPNLQNIPTLIGPVIRKAFIAPPGWVICEADYSQAELRVAAWYSKDKKLVETYREGGDVHTIVAAEVFSVPYDEVTYQQRYIAKYIDFGIIYGRGASSLAAGELDCSVEEAQLYINRFLGQFRGLRNWIRDQHVFVRRHGYVQTPLGRRRRFSLIIDTNLGDVQRQSVNSPIQSLASDLTLMSLTKLHHEILNPNEARIISTVHDSILFEIREDVVDEVSRTIQEIMVEIPKRVLGSLVPFRADVGWAKSWGDIDK